MPDFLRRFLQSPEFFKALVVVTGILAPIGLFAAGGQPQVGISLAIGVFLCSFSDVAGSRRHRLLGVAVAAMLAALTTLAIHLALPLGGGLAPVLAALVFANAMLAVYGFRASLVSLSGLLAIVLAFARPLEGAAMWRHAGLVFAGGLWYLALSSAAYRLTARRRNLLRLAECMRLTARYLRLRAETPGDDPGRQADLLALQRELNAQHESLREIFFSRRLQSGTSSSANRPLLILIELIDLLELALSEAADYRRLRGEPAEKEAADWQLLFRELTLALAGRLGALAEDMSANRRIAPDEELPARFAAAARRIAATTRSPAGPAPETGVTLQTGLDHAQKQWQKIQHIERILSNMNEQAHLKLDDRSARRFITGQDYDLRVLRQHLTSRSPIFRHALRLTVTVLAGYGLGHLLPIANPYWILLTVIVIMRPSYGLTKERSRQRLVGTLIGGVIAAGIVLLTHDRVVYAVLAILSLIFALSLVQKNYRTSAVFITLSIVFLYALSTPDAFAVIQYRVVDTAIGAAMAFLAGLFLWPFWESTDIRTPVAAALRANADYLCQISAYYEKKGELPVAYRLARKEAFLANGNLSAAFQRMTQEPKRKQQKLPETYEMVVLSHTFLQAAAALGAFIQHHPTTPRSGHFQAFINSTLARLEEARASLEGTPVDARDWSKQVAAAEAYLTERLAELTPAAPPGRLAPLQEARLVHDQLNWLHELAGNIRQAAEKVG